jgi:uroporphyrinogen-III synthase
LRILITRPKEYVQDLYQKLELLSYTPELFPVIEFRPSSTPETVIKAIQTIQAEDLLIFSSRAAVQYGLIAIHKKWPEWPNLRAQIAAIGPGTADTLHKFGIQTVLIPSQPPYESESLLDILATQKLQGRKIFLFRGQSGRDLLPDSLRAQGALVKIVNCYQRQCPSADTLYMQERIAHWQKNPIDAIITTSQEALNNLKILVGQSPWQSQWRCFQETPIVVVGERMWAQALELELRYPIRAEGAGDDCLIDAIQKIKQEVQDRRN